MRIGVLHPVAKRALTCAVVILGTAAVVHAETFPVTATVRFETGMRQLATITLKSSATVDWGDGSAVQAGLLVNCRDTLNQTCDIFGTHTYQNLGNYPITITYTPPGLFSSPTSVTTTAHVVPVGDFVILSIGDSVASGEGNPVVARFEVWDGPILVNQGLWDDPESNYGPGDGCHRSAFSGPGFAASFLKVTNPSSGITFIHVACSGAKIGNIRTALRDARFDLESARLQAGGLPGGDPINVDALLISAGGNNLQGGFGSLISACIFGDCTTLDLSADFAALPAAYQSLADAINVPHEGSRGTVSNIYISEYFDPTHDENGEFPDGCAAAAPISQSEWAFFYSDVVVPLNQAVATAASTHGWHLAGGIASAFLTHGYCTSASQRWIVRAEDSVFIQGNQLGSGHPNLAGQLIYRNSLVNSIIAFTPPETTATAIAGGHPYSFGAWTPYDVVVSLVAENPIGQSGVGKKYFAVDDPACTPQSRASCAIYTVPFVISASGEHVVSFFSENQFGAPERLTTVLVRIDKDPPKMTCVPTPDVLWSPNGKMIPVGIAVTAVDDVSGPVPFVLASFGASEGSVSDDMHGFITGGPDTDGLLRAARFGFGPGRQYSLTYQSTDAVGNVGTCAAIVTVPHDQRKER